MEYAHDEERGEPTLGGRASLPTMYVENELQSGSSSNAHLRFRNRSQEGPISPSSRSNPCYGTPTTYTTTSPCTVQATPDSGIDVTDEHMDDSTLHEPTKPLRFMQNHRNLYEVHFGYQAVVTHAIADTLLPYFEGLDLPEASHLCGFDASYSVFSQNIRENRLENIRKEIIRQHGSEVELGQDDQGRWQVPAEVRANPNVRIEEIVHTKRFDLLSTSGVNMPPSPYPWEVFPNERSVFELASTEYHKGRALILFPQNYSPKVVEFEFYNKAPHIDVILDKAFTVRQGFMDEASAYLIRIAADFRAKKTKNAKRAKKSKQPLTYVGIHSRRTDHLAFEVENNYVELRPSYYLKAMDLFRDKFKNVIFVYISDDVPWGKAKLTPRNKAGDLYFGADGLPEGMDSLGFDLALMKLCNHTIISHGTFSYWVGFLAGGSVITPNHFEEFRKPYPMDDLYLQHPLDYPLPRLYSYV